MTASPALDHIVVNAMCDLETVAACFVDLGFHLTPLGRHSLGSINHLMMTPGAYLELVGVPATGLQRPDVLSSPLGLNGLVLASEDADATFERLAAGGPSRQIELAVAFSRPVEIDGQLPKRRDFAPYRVPSETFPAGPRLFLRASHPGRWCGASDWFDHPNGFCRDRLGIAVDEPRSRRRTRGDTRAVCGPGRGARRPMVAAYPASATFTHRYGRRKRRPPRFPRTRPALHRLSTRSSAAPAALSSVTLATASDADQRDADAAGSLDLHLVCTDRGMTANPSISGRSSVEPAIPASRSIIGVGPNAARTIVSTRAAIST